MDLHNKLRSEKQLYTTVVTNVKEYAEMADHAVVSGKLAAAFGEFLD